MTSGQPVASSPEELIRNVPLFAELTAEQAEELHRAGRHLRAEPGELVIREGTPGDCLMIILSGEVEVTKRDGDREVPLATRRAGEFLGEMSLLEQTPRTASIRAVEESELLAISPAAFRRLLEGSPATATTVLRTVAGRLRSTEASLVQSDRLAALGTLAAGLAHELNNPAAAIRRSSETLAAAFESWRRRTVELGTLEMTPEERVALVRLERAVAGCGVPLEQGAALRREESRLLARLESLGVDEPWEVAPALAAFGWTRETLDETIAAFRPGHAAPVLEWLGAGLTSQQLMEEIRRSATAISDIVGAVKSYAYLDQAPVQVVDVVRSLEDTLVILRHKLTGVEVVRDFEAGLPRLEAHAGELNQVWTNLIDNAVQAMDGAGRLELRTRNLGDAVEVRIADSGPGIPPELAQRIFEPFFTTKAQGVGTGLGLHIARTTVVTRHRGRISVDSRPGRTEFRVVLPLLLAGPAAPGGG